MSFSRHTLSYCVGCQTDMVICADCGNNCCNSGTRNVNGKRCGCEEAYEHQAMQWNNANSVRFAKDTRATTVGPMPDI